MPPQLRVLAELQGALGVPVQIGGSFARGEADEFSDLDLTFAPPPSWDVASLGGTLVAVQEVQLGPTLLLHALAYDGTVVDLIPGPPPEGARGADEFAALAVTDREILPIETSVLAEYWTHTHKHRKPIGRGLGAMATLGLAHDRTFLMRLWSLADGHEDPGANLGGIHAMSPLIRRVVTPARRELLGFPVRTDAELLTAIEAIQTEVAGLGLSGADRTANVVRAAFVEFRNRPALESV